MSNSLDQDQDQCSVGPGLGSYCLQRLSADEKRALLVMKELNIWISGAIEIIFNGLKREFELTTV